MRRCIYCGAEMKAPLHLVTCKETKHMLNSAYCEVDMRLQAYLQRFGEPTEDVLTQVAFSGDDDIPDDLRGVIQQIGDRYYYTSEESSFPNVPVTNLACEHCHSNITNVLSAKKCNTVVMVAPPEAGKTITLASLSASLRSDQISPGFSAASFEQSYYTCLAADLLQGKVPDATPFLSGKSMRQPTYFLQSADGTLTAIVDQSGENIAHNQLHIPAGSTVAFLIDGQAIDNAPITDYLRIAAEYPYIHKYIIVVTKSDLLDQDSVNHVMLTEYKQRFPFSYRELQYMRRSVAPQALNKHFPVVAQLMHQLRLMEGRSVDVLFTSAIGTSAKDGHLQGAYAPKYLTDFALAMAQ